jgi:galactokinase
MKACPGVYGARMVGGGFGGCSLCLVDSPHLDQVIDTVRTEYGEMLGRPPWVHAVTASDPVGPAPTIELPGVSHSEGNS